MSFRYLLSCISLGMLLISSGCAMQNKSTMQNLLALPDRFSESAEEHGAPADGSWWEAFSDLHLNALIEEAFNSNLDLALAYARLAQAEALAEKSAALRFPTLNLNGQSSRDQQQNIFGETRSTSASISVAAGYEVDLWKKLSSQRSAAELDHLAAREEVQTLYITVSAQLADPIVEVVNGDEQHVGLFEFRPAG